MQTWKSIYGVLHPATFSKWISPFLSRMTKITVTFQTAIPMYPMNWNKIISTKWRERGGQTGHLNSFNFIAYIAQSFNWGRKEGGGFSGIIFFWKLKRNWSTEHCMLQRYNWSCIDVFVKKWIFFLGLSSLC